MKAAVEQHQQRALVLLGLDQALDAARKYIEASIDTRECARLAGFLPELERARVRFEQATAPDDISWDGYDGPCCE